MKILFINPNSTQSMTDKVLQSAEWVVPPDVTVLARTNSAGPASIQGREDGLMAVPGMLDVARQAITEGVEALIIACFDDTGLEEARALSTVPVLGIGQAAYHVSMLRGLRFSVVTTLSVSLPVIEENIQRFGVASHCCRVRASEVPVLDLEHPGSDAEQRVSDEIAAAIREDGCEAIVLGCAGMTDLAERLSKQHRLPVIDGVVAAAAMASALPRTLGLQSHA